MPTIKRIYCTCCDREITNLGEIVRDAYAPELTFCSDACADRYAREGFGN